MADLQFLSLHIENFKSFLGSHDFDLSKPPGLYYISGTNKLAPELGANGVGKSTLFDAMLWCLWGKTGRDNRPANAIQPWGKKGSTDVQLTFEREKGWLQTIKRTRSPNHLIVQWADGEKEIQQEDIPGLIGMSEEMFRRTLILGQFGQLFLDLKPEAQSQMFTEALSLDIWLKAAQLAGDAEKATSKAQAQAETDLTVCKALLDNLSTQIENSAADATRFETDRSAHIAKIEKGIKTLEDDLAALKEIKSPTEPENKELRKLNDDAHVMRLRWERLRLEAKHLGDAVDKADDLLKALKAQAKAKKKKCLACGQEISAGDYKAKLTEAETTIASAKLVYEAALKTRDDLDEDIVGMQERIDEGEATFVAEREAYQETLAAFNTYHDTLRANQAELQRQKSQLKVEQNATNVFQQSVDVNKTRRQSKRAEKGELETKLAGFGAQIEQAKFWSDAYREIRLGIIDEALIELEMASARHIAMLGLNDWGVRFETERETNAGKVSYGFTVMLYPPGEDQSVKFESYSGGESQRLQLAVSFALSEVLLARAGLSPNMEVYDEPTRGLSPQGIDDLLEYLRERALELGRAVFVVDHHSFDRGLFDGVLMITKDKKGSSAKWL